MRIFAARAALTSCSGLRRCFARRVSWPRPITAASNHIMAMRGSISKCSVPTPSVRTCGPGLLAVEKTDIAGMINTSASVAAEEPRRKAPEGTHAGCRETLHHSRRREGTFVLPTWPAIRRRRESRRAAHRSEPCRRTPARWKGSAPLKKCGSLTVWLSRGIRGLGCRRPPRDAGLDPGSSPRSRRKTSRARA